MICALFESLEVYCVQIIPLSCLIDVLILEVRNKWSWAEAEALAHPLQVIFKSILLYIITYNYILLPTLEIK